MADNSKSKPKILQHFNKRADRYNDSASWVQDEKLAMLVLKIANPQPHWKILDLATGTGQIAKLFQGKVHTVFGLDICPDMYMQNKSTDELVVADAHSMPFANRLFDLVICRQGLQFMNLEQAYFEIERIIKPGGSVVFVHLTSYGIGDEIDTFFTQKLRNNARINFFKPKDIPRSLQNLGFQLDQVHDYPTTEKAFQWLDNGAVSEEEIEQAIKAYKTASFAFQKSHRIMIEGKQIVDTMNMQIVRATKPLR